MKTLIDNIDIMTMDENHTFYKNGCILIEGDSIVYLGDKSGLGSGTEYQSRIDGKRKLALPGFINTHTHTAMTLFRGQGSDMPLMSWLQEKIWPLEDKLKETDTYWLSLLAIAEMIRGGVTTFSDMYMFMEGTAQAVRDSGGRGILARGLQGPDDNSQKRLQETRELWQDWQDKAEGRIQVMAGPHAIYTCQPSYLLEIAELADELDIGIHIHLSETRQEVEDCYREYNKSPVRLLYDLGILDRHVLAAHCVHLSPEDIDILAEKEVAISHCPISNLKLGSGIASVGAMLEKGITFSLGTDGAASNNNLSIMKEMSMAALIHKGVKEDPTLISASKALEMATIGGASALKMEDKTGSLTAGKKADIVLIDTGSPHYHPAGDWASHLVYSGYAHDVDTVWVNGQKLMEKKQLLTIDLESVYSQVDAIYRRIMEREQPKEDNKKQ